MPEKVSYNPVFYFERPNLRVPIVGIPAQRYQWMEEMRFVRRYEYKGYLPIIRDNLLAHTLRVTKWAYMLQYLEHRDILEIANMAMVHDVGELGKSADITVVDKNLDPEAARQSFVEEEVMAREKLTTADFELWTRYETAKPLLEGKTKPSGAGVDYNAVVAKIVDVAENETYFRKWYLYLLKKHGPEIIKQRFPKEALMVTFPRLRKYQANLPGLCLPAKHQMVVNELFAEIEANGRFMGQVEV